MQKQIQVDATKLKNEVCKCGGKWWEKSHVLKVIPGLMIGQSQSTLSPIEFYRCEKCKEPHPSLLPMLKEPADEPKLKAL